MSPKQPSQAGLSPSQIAAYLDRIGYRGSVLPTAEVLRELHRAHLLTVPFENLDISEGRPIRLDTPSLAGKIIEGRRGGFCYELNGLFAELLRGLGFRVDLLSAGVAGADGGFSPEYDHLTLLVHLDDKWLADVGFGDSFLEPRRLVGSEAGDDDPAGRFRLRTAGPYYEMQRWASESWRPQYRFSLNPHPLDDFHDRCRHQQTSPESHFTKGRICSLARVGGRISLSDLRLITTTGSGRDERTLSGEAEFRSLLQAQFGIVTGAGGDDAPAGHSAAGQSNASSS